MPPTMANLLLENELYRGLYHTSILLIIIIISSLSMYCVLKYGFKISTPKNKLKKRIAYVASVLMVFFLAKVWVHGFTQIFYGLSLVSAGLVVTNKETIMNLVGWCIISWRGLFSEGDYIEITSLKGVIYELGVFYFKILESSPTKPARSTGKIIKIPNGTVIHNAVKRVSLEHHFIEHYIEYLVPVHVNITSLRESILTEVNSVLEKHPEASKYPHKIKKERSCIKDLVYQQPTIDIQFHLDKPDYLKVVISYHCKAIGAEAIENQIKDKLLLNTGKWSQQCITTPEKGTESI